MMRPLDAHNDPAAAEMAILHWLASPMPDRIPDFTDRRNAYAEILTELRQQRVSRGREA